MASVTELLQAVNAGDESAVLSLLATVNVDEQDHRGITALHAAVVSKNASMVQRLLENGADPTMKTHSGNTPLMVAQKVQDDMLVSILKVAESVFRGGTLRRRGKPAQPTPTPAPAVAPTPIPTSAPAQTPEAIPSSGVFPGMKIRALWPDDGYWYDAHVQSITDGVYRLTFDGFGTDVYEKSSNETDFPAEFEPDNETLRQQLIAEQQQQPQQQQHEAGAQPPTLPPTPAPTATPAPPTAAPAGTSRPPPPQPRSPVPSSPPAQSDRPPLPPKAPVDGEWDDFDPNKLKGLSAAEMAAVLNQDMQRKDNTSSTAPQPWGAAATLQLSGPGKQAPGEGQVFDFLNLVGNKELQRCLSSMADKGEAETISFADEVVKINRKNKRQMRVLIVTSRAVYNFAKSKYKDPKRRIMISDLCGLYLSNTSNEIVFKVADDYDYRFAVDKRSQLLMSITRHFVKSGICTLPITYSDKGQLTSVTTTRK